MPVLTTEHSRKCRTLLSNLDEVAAALDREPIEILRFFGAELGVSTDRSSGYIGGRWEAHELQMYLYDFIDKFVLCKTCSSPETAIKVKKNLACLKCHACGTHTHPDPSHKVCRFLVRNKKRERSNRRKRKAREGLEQSSPQNFDAISSAANICSGDESDDATHGVEGASGGGTASQAEVTCTDEGGWDIHTDIVVKELERLMNTVVNQEQEPEEAALDLLSRSRPCDSAYVLVQAIFFNDEVGRPQSAPKLSARQASVMRTVAASSALMKRHIISALERLCASKLEVLAAGPSPGSSGARISCDLSVQRMLKLFPFLLKVMYDCDVLDEDTILTWSASRPTDEFSPLDVSPESLGLLRTSAEELVVWLQQADEEEEGQEGEKAKVIEGDSACVPEDFLRGAAAEDAEDGRNDRGRHTRPERLTPGLLVDIGVNLTKAAFRADAQEVVHRAANAGVSPLVITGTSTASTYRARGLVQKLCVEAAPLTAEGVSSQATPTSLFYTAGVHPLAAASWSPAAAAELRSLVGPRCVAIGECGLDISDGDVAVAFEAQKMCFVSQLELACELNKPVFLHERGCFDRMVMLLASYLVKGKRRLPQAVVHCFSGTADQCRTYLDMGLHIGITGMVCKEKMHHLRVSVLPVIPLSKMMLETDAPYLHPTDDSGSGTGARCEPRHVIDVCEAVALAKGASFERVAAETTATAHAFFRFGDASIDTLDADIEEEPSRHRPSQALPLEQALTTKELESWRALKKWGQDQNRISRGEEEKKFLQSLSSSQARASLRRERKDECKRAREHKHERERQLRRAAATRWSSSTAESRFRGIGHNKSRMSASVRLSNQHQVHDVPNQQQVGERSLAGRASDGELDELCSICTEECVEPERLACGHMFCSECLARLRSHPKVPKVCPNCRGPLASK